MENWAWVECQLGNIAKRAKQLNLLVENKTKQNKRKHEGNKGKEKRKKEEKVGK